MVYRASADTELGADFGLSHSVHIAVQYGEFQCGELQGVDKFVVFAVIRLFVFKTIYGIHGQSLVICKVYGLNDFAAVDVREELCKTKPPEKANSEGLLQSDNHSEEIAGKKYYEPRLVILVRIILVWCG